MKFLSIFLLQILFLLSFKSLAGTSSPLITGDTNLPVSVEDSVKGVRAGQVVILGELHGMPEVALSQMQVIENIKKNGNLVSVGMEFFEYPQQNFVNDYRAGILSEPLFLKQINWGGFPFDSYRQQVNFPSLLNEFVVGLNAPRELTGKIAKSGMSSLSPTEMNLLPPQFALGSQAYYERFKTVMGQHVPDSALERYFAAQSAWDDTMAWKAADFLHEHPEQVLVIVVGEFHVQYGGGLPDRLRARGINNILTYSFVNTNGLSDDEIKQEVEPSGTDGSRADFIWLLDLKQ